MENKKNSHNNKFFKSRSWFIGGGMIAFLVGIVAASVFWHIHTIAEIQSISAQVKPFRQNSSQYQYINPLLGYDVPGDVKEFNEYKPLENSIENMTSVQKSNLDSYSVYFRDLSLGRWMMAGDNGSYAPASMMKVAIMVAYYKEAEDDATILQHTLVYSTSTADQINGVPFETPSNLQVGKSYTTEQLIEAMIISSDNGAKNILLDNIDQKDLDEIYTDLGLPNPDSTNNYTISAKQYSVLLRVLYNATYLSRNYSEQALKIMSQAKYNQGLVAGVPKGTIVAQKFGENVDDSNGNAPEITLSNCGIVYQQTHPYILCVMTKGKNAPALAKVIAAISQTVWNEVNSYAQGKNY